MEATYLIGRGELAIADRDANGNPGALQDLGEVPEFEVSVDVTFADNFNTKKAISRQDLHVATRQTAKVRIVAKEATMENLALALFGEVVEGAGGNFSAVAFPSGIQAGGTYIIPGNRTRVSSIVITDSAVAPATVDEDDYEVDLVHGTVKFLNVTGYTQPFKIAGTEAADQKSVGLLKKRSQEKFIIFKGVNIADDDAPMQVGLYRVALGPAQKIPYKGEEAAMYELEGNVLSDDEKDEDADLGTFGYHRDLSS
jgi:hypothetical protein